MAGGAGTCSIPIREGTMAAGLGVSVGQVEAAARAAEAAEAVPEAAAGREGRTKCSQARSVRETD